MLTEFGEIELSGAVEAETWLTVKLTANCKDVRKYHLLNGAERTPRISSYHALI